MLSTIIQFSLNNRFAILLLSVLLTGWGGWSLQQIAIDAIPDLSDVQVIVRASYPGQSPQQVENQLTYPLTSQLMAISEAKAVRGFSMLGDAYVYVVFEDGIDYEWARARVLEYLNQVTPRLPPGVNVMVGPEASGVSWVYQYALKDASGRHDLAELRALQDWYLKFELQSLAGVAEVAALGGMVRQYQVRINPDKQRYFGIPLQAIEQAIRDGSRESSGSVVELGEAEYVVHANGYIQSPADLELLPIKGSGADGTPVLLKDIAQITFAPQMRRGIAELNGEGEVVGGIVVMRAGAKPLQVVRQVQQKLDELATGLPEGVEIVTTYDRSQLILRSVGNLIEKLWLEALAITVVCWLFLGRFSSAWVVILSLPIGVLVAFGVMHLQGISANIMSLGGIAIAVGAMVDAAIVMIENIHQHLWRWQQQTQRQASTAEHWQLVRDASLQVGPALFLSLLIITLGFLPVLLLEAEEGRLFAPLAYTKTYAMAAAAALSVTLVPVLAGYFVRVEQPRPLVSRVFMAVTAFYKQCLLWGLNKPKAVMLLCLLVMLSALYPWMKTGNEFMPELDEGDLLYMPTTLPGISAGKARQLLIETDKAILSVPEVAQVFGKAGRAETATDPAPLSMLETLIRLKPPTEWRPGVDRAAIIAELDSKLQLPGLNNAWVQPVKTRIDMLSSGVRTPLGLKVSGADLSEVDQWTQKIEQLLSTLPATRSAFADRFSEGRYIEINPKRLAAARLGISIADIHRTVQLAIGGMQIAESVEGRERYPVTLRYPLYERDSLDKLENIPLISATGKTIPLRQVATLEIAQKPAAVRTENARLAGWVMIDLQDDVDLAAYLRTADDLLKKQLQLPVTYRMEWVGRYEVMQRSEQALWRIGAVVLSVSVLLLWFLFRNPVSLLLALLPVPLAMVGGLWFVWLMGFKFSLATAIGFIALAGVSIEFNVVMLLYLNMACQAHSVNKLTGLKSAVLEGAAGRLRPKLMTVSVIMVGLLMIMLGSGSGVDVMQRIAAPMLGGMLTAPLLSMLIIPVFYFMEFRLIKK